MRSQVYHVTLPEEMWSHIFVKGRNFNLCEATAVGLPQIISGHVFIMGLNFKQHHAMLYNGT